MPARTRKGNTTRLPTAVRKSLFGEAREDALPLAERTERLDMTRCRLYAVKGESEARGLFKAQFKVEASVAAYRPGFGWVVGHVPLVPDDAPSTA